MSAVAVKPRVTPEELLAMPDGERYELVDGELVEREMGAFASLVNLQIARRIANFVADNKLGWPFDSECGYQCFPDDPRRVRRPDASFIAAARLPEVPDGYISIAPDLAVEVISPNDLFYEVEGKVREYRSAGVRLVWVINPQERTAMVYRADGSLSWLHETDELDGEDVLPGFRCPVGALFPVQPGS